MAVFLIDLDHTLFDTEAYKDAVSKELIGILGSVEGMELFWETEKSLRTNPNYFAEVIDTLCHTCAQPEQVKMKLTHLFVERDFSEFIFPDVVTGLEALQQRGQLWLFSTGNLQVQLRKAASIESFFDQIKIFDDKMTQLPEVYQSVKDQEVWFLDNHPTYLSLAQKFDPNLKTVFVNRYHFAKPKDYKPDHEVKTIQEFIDIISS